MTDYALDRTPPDRLTLGHARAQLTNLNTNLKNSAHGAANATTSGAPSPHRHCADAHQYTVMQAVGACAYGIRHGQ